MDTNNLSRKERTYIYHRKEILKTALRLFSERGYHNVSMNEIAKEAEFAVGTLYKFFSNKEEMYSTLVVEKADEFHSALLNALDTGGDELARIRACIDAKIDVFKNNLDFARLYLTETQGACFSIRAGLDEELKRRYEEYLIKLSNVFKEGAEKKIFKAFDPYILAVAIDGITNAFLMEYLEDPEKHRFDAETVMDIFFNSLLER